MGQKRPTALPRALAILKRVCGSCKIHVNFAYVMQILGFLEPDPNSALQLSKKANESSIRKKSLKARVGRFGPTTEQAEGK